MRFNPGAKWLLAVPLAVAVVALTALLVAGAAAKTPVLGPWAGQWSSDWGTMTLSQKGTHVTGRYTFYGGRIDGTAIGRTLTGTWSKAPTYVGPPDAGPIVLQLSPSGLSFTGKWGFEGQRRHGTLTGARLET